MFTFLIVIWRTVLKKGLSSRGFMLGFNSTPISSSDENDFKFDIPYFASSLPPALSLSFISLSLSLLTLFSCLLLLNAAGILS